jgi:hypothetical protein
LLADDSSAAEKTLLEGATGQESEAKVIITQVQERIERLLKIEAERRYDEREGPYAHDPERDERNANRGCVAASSCT